VVLQPGRARPHHLELLWVTLPRHRLIVSRPPEQSWIQACPTHGVKSPIAMLVGTPGSDGRLAHGSKPCHLLVGRDSFEAESMWPDMHYKIEGLEPRVSTRLNPGLLWGRETINRWRGRVTHRSSRVMRSRSTGLQHHMAGTPTSKVSGVQRRVGHPGTASWEECRMFTAY